MSVSTYANVYGLACSIALSSYLTVASLTFTLTVRFWANDAAEISNAHRTVMQSFVTVINWFLILWCFSALFPFEVQVFFPDAPVDRQEGAEDIHYIFKRFILDCQ